MRRVKQEAAISASDSLEKIPTPEAGLVSVIIPCYNQAHFLHEAIQSALALEDRTRRTSAQESIVQRNFAAKTCGGLTLAPRQAQF